MLGVFAIFLLNKDIKTPVYAKDWFAHRKKNKKSESNLWTNALGRLCIFRNLSII